jgi:DNA-binding response OmpR family regulator
MPMLPDVLVVDDDPMLNELFQAAVKLAGCSPTPIGDGISALEYLQSNVPDLILLDLELPRVHGTKILRYISQANHLQSTRIIIVSALTNVTPELFDRRIDRVVTKPVRITVLADTIRIALGL